MNTTEIIHRIRNHPDAPNLTAGELVEDTIHGVAVLEPGWYADDGNWLVHFPGVANAKEAALKYVDGGDWGKPSSTIWVSVRAWRRGWYLDRGTLRSDDFFELQDAIAVHPDEPPCHESEHDWQRPLEIVGGCDRNPGVFGHGGGVIVKEVCAHCGAYRIRDTWSQNPETGEQGLYSIEYRDADGISLNWVREMHH